MTATGAPAPEHTVVHHLPRRVRCRSARLRADGDFARRVYAVADCDERVAALRVNRSAASLAVRWSGPVSEDDACERVAELLRVAQASETPPAAPAERSAVAGRWPRLVLPAALATVTGLGRLLGLALPTPVGAAVVLFASAPIARRAYRSVTVEGRLNLDVLDMTAILLTTLRGSLIAPASIIGLVEVGEAIRERTAQASQRELLDLLDSSRRRSGSSVTASAATCASRMSIVARWSSSTPGIASRSTGESSRARRSSTSIS